MIKKYRKTHLFDLCLPTMTYKESAQFSAGDSLGLFETRESTCIILTIYLQPAHAGRLQRETHLALTSFDYTLYIPAFIAGRANADHSVWSFCSSDVSFSQIC